MKARSPKKAPAKKTPASRQAAPQAAKATKAGPRKKSAPKAKAPAAAPAPVAPVAKIKHPRLLGLVVQALDAKKAEHIQILHVAALSSITDYLVLATATSDPHLRALRVELEKVIDAEGTKILGMDTTQGSGWLVVDAFDVMVHMFTKQNRERYRLDLLWRDAQEVPLKDLV